MKYGCQESYDVFVIPQNAGTFIGKHELISTTRSRDNDRWLGRYDRFPDPHPETEEQRCALSLPECDVAAGGTDTGRKAKHRRARSRLAIPERDIAAALLRVAEPECENKRGACAESKSDNTHVALVCEVGVVALSSVNVIAAVVPSSFFAVSVVLAMLRSESSAHSM